ncbi:geranylgeranyl transferase type-2 subunit alpha 1 isoform X2 [Andrographis paniculata]|nr:geranylgeranyl transferase type-2 subunit alpha 1 isoform X2 [Andrographis paniculata]
MGHSSTDRELRLLGKFQRLDARNFHAWNYRRFIAGLKKIPNQEELQYTTDMIYDNFSNYSAWHNRSVLLSDLLERKEGFFDKENVLGEEYEFVRNALFTDPDDQSGWFYHLWLLDQTLKQEPLFLSSWPPHGANVNLSFDSHFSDQPTLHFRSKAGRFPLIIYFNEAVNGVSSSTVNIECQYNALTDSVWSPLSANKSGYSQAWLTYLKFPDEVDALDACPVKVIVAELPGITSLSGMPCTKSWGISFTVLLYSDNRGQSEVQATHERISWKEENFKSLETGFFHSLCNLEITKENIPSPPKWSLETISNEIDHCQELLFTTNCKIGKLTLARLLMARNTLMTYNRDDGAEFNFEEVLALYNDLMKMDPSHICYYEDEYSLVLLKQLTSNSETLLKHCGEYKEPCSPHTISYLSVRMNGLSLSRIGSMEQLLWVQILDLSHNKLRSIEGLESLQLLSCLKLNNNKFCSFTALEPLKLLNLLEVLDISNNEIGNHSIDTRRYLCSSPLTNTGGSEWQFSKLANSDIQLSHYWDAYLLFKDMNLTQLEITGNAVADERLHALLLELMPGLAWLDSEKRR